MSDQRADGIEEMAMAHMRLSMSLRSLSISSAAYRATEQTLVELSEAMATRVGPRGVTIDPSDEDACTCSVDPLDRMPLIDGRCPVHSRPCINQPTEGGA